MIAVIPLLLIVVVIYNLLAFAQPHISSDPNMVSFLQHPLFSIHMMSGGDWVLSSGDALLFAGLILMFAEIVKSTRTGRATMIDHGLSMVLFVVCIMEFIMLAGFATSVFFLLTMMTALDVVSGFTVSLVAARRDLEVTSVR